MIVFLIESLHPVAVGGFRDLAIKDNKNLLAENTIETWAFPQGYITRFHEQKTLSNWWLYQDISESKVILNEFDLEP